MSPFLIMPTFHLRFKESSKGTIDSPSDSVALDDSALNDDLALEHLMDVDPYAFA